MLIFCLCTILIFHLLGEVSAGTCDWRFKEHEFSNRTVDELCNSTCLLAPNICPNSHVKFYLFKNGDSSGQEIMIDESGRIIGGAVSQGAKVKIIIHGYKGSYNSYPTSDILEAYISSDEYNVISVDYSAFCKANCYASCVNNLRCAANCTGQIIETLVNKNGINKKDIHVIGFSEGAIVAAQIHNYITVGKLSRITSLDPTYSRFVPQPLEMDQLSAEHADFVDVIHTNIGWKGLTDPYGHIDVYVNGGFTQPACNIRDRTCDHDMAAAYFAESISSPNGFWAWECVCKSEPEKSEPEKSNRRSDDSDDMSYYLPSASSISSRIIDPKFTTQCAGKNASSDNCKYEFIKTLRCKDQWSDFALINQCADKPNSTSNFFIEMGEPVDQTARGVYLVFTNNKYPYAKGLEGRPPVEGLKKGGKKLGNEPKGIATKPKPTTTARPIVTTGGVSVEGNVTTKASASPQKGNGTTANPKTETGTTAKPKKETGTTEKPKKETGTTAKPKK